jgi:hypothetical protein
VSLFSSSSLIRLLVKKLLLALLLSSPALTTYAQTQPVNLSNNPSRRPHGFTDENEELPDRNHGTGLRVGAIWADARNAASNRRTPGSFEFGAFHQRALSRVFSVQGEALYYREQAAGATNSGLRLPALLVINPFYNLSLHVGPQLQWRTSAARAYPTTELAGSGPVTTTAASTGRLSTALVVGAEARVGFMRVGLRYGLPFQQMADLPEAGNRFADAWHAGQVQAYLGAGF